MGFGWRMPAILGLAAVLTSGGLAVPASAAAPVCNNVGNRWATAKMCAKADQNIFGVFATWKNAPIKFGKKAATNTFASNSFSFKVGDSILLMGLRAAKLSPSRRDYWPYWSLLNEQGGQQHRIKPPRGPAKDDGVNHTYMVIRRNPQQWDVFYDFNVVGTGRPKGQLPPRAIEVNVSTNDPYNTTIGQMQDRIQFQDGNAVWNRFARNQAATAVNMPGCGKKNKPPLCFKTRLTGSPRVVSWNVEKPGPPARSLSNPAPAPSFDAPVVNGVDQAALARCMSTTPERCMEQVPGLAACVQQRLVCNTMARPNPAGPRPEPPVIGPQQARALVASQFGIRASLLKIRPMTVGAYDAQAHTALRHSWHARQQVWLATSDAEAHASGRTYRGISAVIDAATGQILHVGLGDQRAFR